MAPPYTFALVPSVHADASAALAELTAYLSQAIGAPVMGATPASYGELVSELERDKVQFAWMSPLQMVLAQEQMSLRPLAASIRSGRRDYRSVFFAPAASNLGGLHEMRGRTVAWVDPTSASGYLYPRLHLAARGIDPARFFANELFAGSHRQVVQAVQDGRAEVGATFAERPDEGGPIVTAGFLEIDPARPMRVIEWTANIPTDLVVGHGLLPPRQHDAMQKALLRLGDDDAGRSLLRAVFRMEKFGPPEPQPLAVLRQLVHQARSHGLLFHL